MAAIVPSTEPLTINAGDTISWTRELPDYPASAGWALTYALRLEQGSGLLDITASATAPYLATITAINSALMTPGVWRWAAYVTKAAERYQVGSGSVQVLPNLAKIDASTDLRSPAKVAYDNAMAAWKTFSASKMVILNGRTYQARDAGDLITLVDRCKADYNLEVAGQSGAPRPTRIGVRLNRV